MSIATPKKAIEAIILAGGKGTRLNKHTGGFTHKALISFEGKPLLQYSINALKKYGISQIQVVTGHAMEQWTDFADENELKLTHNPEYETGSLSTLMAADCPEQGEILLLESDLLYHSNAIKSVLTSRSENVILCSNALPTNDNVYVHTDEQGHLKELNKQKPTHKVMTGIWKLQAKYLKAFQKQEFSGKEEMHYDPVLAEYAHKFEQPIDLLHIADLPWCEIDMVAHLRYAQTQVWPQIKDSF